MTQAGPGALEAASGGALLLTVAAAVWFDVRERRIPNSLTVGAFSVALLLRAPLGAAAFAASIGAAAIAFTIALIFFLAGGLGGGDVKFLAAVGAFLDPARLWLALFVTAMVGGLMAIAVILRHRATRRTMADLYGILARTRLRNPESPGGRGPATPIEESGALTVPYGVAIAAGALAGWLL